MRSQSVFIIATLAIVVVIVAALAARKQGFGLELTRNAGTHRRTRELQGNAHLHMLAANPKLTVVRQAIFPDPSGKRNPVTLCILNRHILSILSISSDSPLSGRPLLERLESVNIEPVAYDHTELPALIAELAAVSNAAPSSAFRNDLNTLLVGLQKGDQPGSEIVFY
jgi:hypothetical protein